VSGFSRMERSRSHQSARREWELTAGSADYPVSARWVSHSTGLLVTAVRDLNPPSRSRATAGQVRLRA